MIKRKPEWLKVRVPAGENYSQIKSMLRQRKLFTVCEEANCPNIGECWAGGTATIMVMGDSCTRACRFCNVKTGNPKAFLDPLEPQKVAKSLQDLNLEYVVITTVDRDDLEDHGAKHFAAIVRTTKQNNPNLMIECLSGDFRGEADSLAVLLESGLDVFAHNIETVRRLTPTVRDRRASYEQSLQILADSKKIAPKIPTKSSIMLGLGETEAEVKEALQDLRAIDVDFVTLGQYLQPTKRLLPVDRFVSPEEFKAYETYANELGFQYAASGPLVRSSYKAGEFYIKSLLKKRKAKLEDAAHA